MATPRPAVVDTQNSIPVKQGLPIRTLPTFDFCYLFPFGFWPHFASSQRTLPLARHTSRPPASEPLHDRLSV